MRAGRTSQFRPTRSRRPRTCRRARRSAAANKINVLSFKVRSQATSAVVTGKADAMLADSPVVAYAVKQSGGKLATLGDIYEAAPYGYVLPKARPISPRRSWRR